jgi:hypothetical protein
MNVPAKTATCSAAVIVLIAVLSSIACDNKAPAQSVGACTVTNACDSQVPVNETCLPETYVAAWPTGCEITNGWNCNLPLVNCSIPCTCKYDPDTGTCVFDSVSGTQYHQEKKPTVQKCSS